jgi:hypothetical protein
MTLVEANSHLTILCVVAREPLRLRQIIANNSRSSRRRDGQQQRNCREFQITTLSNITTAVSYVSEGYFVAATIRQEIV